MIVSRSIDAVMSNEFNAVQMVVVKVEIMRQPCCFVISRTQFAALAI